MLKFAEKDDMLTDCTYISLMTHDVSESRCGEVSTDSKHRNLFRDTRPT